MFTHAFSSSQHSINTFQVLSNESSHLGADETVYASAVTRILDAVGSATKSSDFDILQSTLSITLVQMAYLLQTHKRVNGHAFCVLLRPALTV